MERLRTVLCFIGEATLLLQKLQLKNKIKLNDIIFKRLYPISLQFNLKMLNIFIWMVLFGRLLKGRNRFDMGDLIRKYWENSSNFLIVTIWKKMGNLLWSFWNCKKDNNSSWWQFSSYVNNSWFWSCYPQSFGKCFPINLDYWLPIPF